MSDQLTSKIPPSQTQEEESAAVERAESVRGVPRLFGEEVAVDSLRLLHDEQRGS